MVPNSVQLTAPSLSRSLTSGVSLIDFGSTEIGIPVSHFFEIQNAGSGNLVIGNLRQLPSGYRLGVGGFPSPGTVVAPGATEQFELVLDAASPVSISTNLIFKGNRTLDQYLRQNID